MPRCHPVVGSSCRSALAPPQATRSDLSFLSSPAAILGGIVLLLLAWPHAAAAQPLPVTRLAYSAKYLCGMQPSTDWGLPPGSGEYTLIEVHNPHTIAVTCSVKVVQDYPFSQIVTPQYAVTVPANGTLAFDCSTIVPGFYPGQPRTGGFVEIVTPRQLKVVALYKEILAQGGVTKAASIAKKSSPAFIILGTVRHSATLMVGDDATAVGDTIRHETTVSIANMSPNVVNANVTIVSKAGPVTSFLKVLQPNGFTTVTGADLPPATPLPFVGGCTVQYPDIGVGAQLECEEIIQKHVISGAAIVGMMGMSVVEVQPIPLR